MAAATADEFKLRYPVIEYRELEVEHNGAVTFDRRNSGKNNAQTYTNELEYAFIPEWKVGLEAALEASPGQNLRWEASALENYVQLTPQGKYWADLAAFVEFERPTSSKSAPSITFGPLVQKEIPNVFGIDTVHTANLLFTKEVGHLADPGTPVLAAWQSRLRLHPMFEPGFEYYGGIEDIGHAGSLSDQQHRIGPMLAGLYAFPPYGKLKYEAGYLFGLTAAAEKGVARWRLEYEIAF
ncbi:MAG: hypothetical protein ACM3JG_18910 [Thiohalocapsa sp.]